jgi:hypothetical protein
MTGYHQQGSKIYKNKFNPRIVHLNSELDGVSIEKLVQLSYYK